MAYRWLGVLLLSAACVVGCGTDGTGGPRGDGGVGGDAGTGGTAGAGGSQPACMTSVLCRSCPTEGFCNTNDDCAVGSVCIESGCDSLEGDPIKQCVFAGGGACTSDAMCTPFGRECVDVPEEGKRCVKTTPGCDTSFDCVLGFACENGTCVDRRLACDLDDHCPKNHICAGTASSSFCLRIQRGCAEDFDCEGLAPRCANIDGDLDGNKECAGTWDPNQPSADACVNSDCTNPSAPVCEAVGPGSGTDCGQYGLCLSDSDCDVDSGFKCEALWPDGRKECVPSGGSCSSFGNCPARQVCASPRTGGPASCQAGFQP
jgi:hypothetical protein